MRRSSKRRLAIDQRSFLAWAGLASLLVVMLIVATVLLGDEATTDAMYVSINLLLLVSLTGVYVLQRKKGGVLGLTGCTSPTIMRTAEILFVLAFVGIGLTLLGESRERREMADTGARRGG